MKYWIYKYICIVYFYIRFGRLTERVMMNDWYVAEIEYKDRNGRQVGYWAYGYFEPNQPYQGQPALFIKESK